MQITVTCKDNLGFSPKFGPITKGRQLDIDETEFADELFEPLTPKKTPANGTAEGGPQ